MELKAIHLIRRLERIDRDLEELNSIQEKIKEDREYASRIIDPLQEESIRLKKIRLKILSQVIKNPPENFHPAPVQNKNPEVEIIVKKETKMETSEKKKKSTSADAPKASLNKGSKDSPKSNPYKFIFDQEQ